MGFLHALFEQADESLDFLLLIQPAEADPIDIGDRHHQTGVIGEESEVVIRVIRTQDWRRRNLLDDGHSMVRIDELFPDLETHFYRRHEAPFGMLTGATEGRAFYASGQVWSNHGGAKSDSAQLNSSVSA